MNCPVFLGRRMQSNSTQPLTTELATEDVIHFNSVLIEQKFSHEPLSFLLFNHFTPNSRPLDALTAGR